MPFKYAYNPINNLLDITGKENGANGGSFVGVTGMLSAGSGTWAHICQIQFTCDDITSEEKKKNLLFDGIFAITKQNANPYSFDSIQKSCKLDVHIQIPFITDSNDNSNHYTKAQIGLLDVVNIQSNQIVLVETVHIVSYGKAYVYCDLYVQLDTLYDRYFYTFVTNANSDEFNRVKIVPAIGENPEYIPYGTGYRWYGIPNRSEYTQQVTEETYVTINHNLNTYPNVVIIDATGNQCFADIQFVDKNMLTITFSESFSGTIYCK